MRFFKMNGLGNDYIFIDLDENTFSATVENIKRLCDPHRAIGGDGVVTIGKSDVAVAKMTIYNKDGSRAEMCGNALRCVTKMLYDRGLIKSCGSIETDSGVKTVAVEYQNLQPVRFDTEIGVGRYIGLNTLYGVDAHSIDVGNPHAVVFDDVVNIAEMGRLLSEDRTYPNRTNVEFVKVVDRKTLRVRVYERGSGITQACGTGAAAAAYCSMLLGAVDNEVAVDLDGGRLFVRLVDGKLFVNGTAEYNYCGEINF